MNAKLQREQILEDLRSGALDQQSSADVRERMQKFIQEFPTDEVIIEYLSQLEERPPIFLDRYLPQLPSPLLFQRLLKIPSNSQSLSAIAMSRCCFNPLSGTMYATLQDQFAKQCTAENCAGMLLFLIVN